MSCLNWMSLITVAPPWIGNLEFRIKRPVTAALKGASPLSIQVLRKGKKEGRLPSNSNFLDCARLVECLSSGKVTHITHALYPELKSEKLLPDYATLSAVMLCYAEKGFVLEAHEIWEEILYSSFVPDRLVISRLINAYGRIGRFDEVINIIGEVGSRHSDLLPDVYSLAISCFGKNGQIQLMENMLNEMLSKGIIVDSTTWNAIIKYYSLFGSLKEIEHAYGRLKRSTVLIEKEGIRAISLVYLKLRKFYRLREFLIDVGLGRKNVGNLLWNLVLLSYAADFKMKSLQREFLNMLDNGFFPDLTTFNIRALAFSKMAMFWDLHLTLEHMRQRNIKPDLVTFGCVVDAYMDRRLGKNIEFAYGKMNPDVSAEVLTDTLVFEVLGKGDFHLSSEAFLEFSISRKWTYRKLVGTYLKKMFRRDQIFWNY